MGATRNFLIRSLLKQNLTEDLCLRIVNQHCSPSEMLLVISYNARILAWDPQSRELGCVIQVEEGKVNYS